MQFQIYTKAEAYALIAELVGKFEEFLPHYKSGTYNETQTRIEFVNPFFRALNWDINNDQNFAPFRKEVVHEALLRKGISTKYPDYLFRREENRNFFYVETKKPSVNIKDDSNPAQQLRLYGWQGGLLISLLTDFEEFALYNTTRKPTDKDTAQKGRLLYYTYKDYLKEFDFFWDTFEKNNVMQGSIDKLTQKYAKDFSQKESVTVVFLKELEKWRAYLATSLVTRNPEIDEFDLNYAVQQTLDRLLFLKIAEDRNIESKNQLKECTKKGNIYENVYQLFYAADQRYNSGLFDFKKDHVTRHLKVDNKVIKNIILELYAENGFDFSVIPVEILGAAYEQFLGSVITIDEQKTAHIDTKLDVRRAGGVYYTPQYIVDYIVQQTIGKAIAQQTPEQIAQLKILDPSCGSGSFLLGAYQYLLNYHEDYYRTLKNQGKKVKELTPDDTLTSAVKKQILLNNIFGVDIDTQAVEVAKLSLLIKCLEGETPASVKEQNILFKDRVLPTLDNNILCGNSLINHDFYDTGFFPTSKEMRKINTFDWKQGFAEVFKQGGFDCVIGNPPYGAVFSEPQKSYLKNRFKYADIELESYLLFIEKAIQLTKNQATVSLIVPSNLLTNLRYSKIRKLLLTQTNIELLLDLGANVFKQASVDTCIFVFSKGYTPENKIKTFVGNFLQNMSYKEFLQDDFLQNTEQIFNIYTSKEEKTIEYKIANHTTPLQQLVKFARGVEYGYQSVYVVDKPKKGAKPIVAGRCIKRYNLTFEGKYVLYDEKDLSNFKDRSIYENEKLLIRRIGHEIIAVYDNQHYYNVCDVYNVLAVGSTNLKYILGILNSKLMSFYMNVKFKNSKKLFPKIPIAYLEQLPIKVLDLNNKQQKQQYEQLIMLVEKLMDLQQKITAARVPQDKVLLGRVLEATENQLDNLIYQLYQLSPEEIAMIEKHFTS